MHTLTLTQRGEPKVEWSLEDQPQGRSLGRYKLIASLGQGGMANVYLAVAAGPASFSKLLVVKALRADVPMGSEPVTMFLDEARLAARFNHPNIVQTYEVGEANGRYFIAMEYLEGQSLRAVQRKLPGTFPLEEELRVIAETARGLHYAHEIKDFSGSNLHVVHRDVSPQNVFLTYDGQVKLLDFGIAKALDSENLTQVGLIKGKVDYIAPEQARGDHVDRRADVFSLGVMAWEAVARQRFSGGHSVQAVTKLHKRLTGGEPDLLDVQPEAPEQLVHIIRRALALEPEHRTETAAAFANEIYAFLDATNLRPSAQTLSERLARPFMAERAKIAAVVEEQLKRIHEGARGDTPDDAIPNIDRTDVTISRAVPKPLEGALPEEEHTSRSVPMMGSLGSVHAVSSRPTSGVHWLRTRSGKVTLGAAALALGAGLALVGTREPAPATQTHSVGAAPPATQQASVSAPQQLEAPPNLPNVSLTVSVSPPEAKASLDGANLPKLPFQAELLKDGRIHHLEASAQGYESKKVAVPFDQDRVVHVELTRLTPESEALARKRPRVESQVESGGEPTVSAGAATSAMHQAAPEPGQAIVTRRRAGLRIDKTDPYAE